MKKYILISLILASCCIAASARELTKGYRGFFELTGEVQFMTDYNTNHYAPEKESLTYLFYGISTSHGYQIDPHFFIGAGISAHIVAYKVFPEVISFPVFVQFRTDWTFGKVPLYGDFRLGVTYNGRSFDNLGTDAVFATPTVGYRLDWGRKVAMNFGIGVALHGYSYRANHTSLHWKALPSVKVGIEF